MILLIRSAFLLADAPADMARGLLHADGILSVEGLDASESLITVMPADGGSYKLAKGTTQFKLELKLNNKYMVRFERPGCLTKDLYFDTTVPVEYQLDEYTFPFQVVLEADRRVDQRSYAGPVGYIQYLEPVNDFDYVTDYTMVIDKRIQQTMETLYGIPPTSIGEEVATQITPPPATKPLEIAEESGPPPAIDRDEPIAPVRITPADAGELMAMAPAPVTPRPVEVPAPVEIGEGVVEVEEIPEIEDPAPRPATIPVERKLSAPDPTQEGRMEELIVEDRKVTTIVRIVNEQGFQHEYRRVAHKYGAVFYFMDEQSIPEHMYRELTGLPAAANFH